MKSNQTINKLYTNFITGCFYEFKYMRGCTDCLYEFEYIEKLHTKINIYSNNAYKDFHAFAYISMKLKIFTTTIKLTIEYSNIESPLYES